MPVIRVDTTTTTLSPEERTSFLTTLKGEFKHSTERGPVIFEIPLGTEYFDVLVVWEAWADWPSEERSRLILDAYDEHRREQIAQVTGVTYDEAIQQQFLPYTIVSIFERYPRKFALLLKDKDENKVNELMDKIRKVKVANGGIVLPDGKVELRFPTRVMLDNVLARLKAADPSDEFCWSVDVETAVSDRLGIGE